MLAIIGLRHDVGDVVPRVAVQGLLQAALVQIMACHRRREVRVHCSFPKIKKMRTDEAKAAAQHEEAVEGPDVDGFPGLLWGEHPGVAENVDKDCSDGTVHVQNQIWLLNFFNFSAFLPSLKNNL